MAIRVRDLKSYIGKPGPRPFLWCSVCGGECSAESGDYFLTSPKTVMMCCEVPMKRVIKIVSYEEVK